MAYAGENLGVANSGTYAGDAVNNQAPLDASANTTAHATAAVVIGALIALIAIRAGFRGVSVSGVTGGLVRS